MVTKFIDKSKIPEEDWLADPAGTGARSPMEAALLSTLSHDNIVTVLDVFDNDSCVQVRTGWPVSSATTGPVDRISHRKWRETKEQLI